DPRRGRAALTRLPFYVHADLFMSPTAELADIVLPVSSCWERPALQVGFGLQPPAATWVQWRPAAVPPVGEARSDTEIVFDLAVRFPLVLTCAKSPQYCQSQHRALPRLRRLAPDPELELHTRTAAERGIVAGDWVVVETPAGPMQVRARLNDSLDPRVVCGQ